MTANAMKGDKEKCLLAGMNDYLSKPIDGDILHAKMQEWLIAPANNVNIEEHNHNNKPQKTDGLFSTETWDMHDALKRLQGNNENLRTVSELFLKDMPKIIFQLEEALSGGSFVEAKAVAHTIKGVAATLSGGTLTQLAHNIETSSDRCDQDSLNQLKLALSNTLPVNRSRAFSSPFHAQPKNSITA